MLLMLLCLCCLGAEITVVCEYLYRRIEDKKVREFIDFLLNREESHNALFREAFNEV